MARTGQLMTSRGPWRRLAFGASTLLGLSRRGWFLPYRYAADLPAPPARYPAIERLMAAAEPDFAAHMDAIDGQADAFARIARPNGEPEGVAPRFDQDWFPRLDAAAAYAMVRRLRPARIVDIGSGHSTRFLARAIADGALATRLTAIDPAPRADVAGAVDELLRDVVQRVPAPRLTALVEALGPGDILFVDSSHLLMPGSDVELVLTELLPRLASGVALHVHDVFLPDAYPPEWEWRGYNEQGAIAPLLGAGWRPLFASRYVATRMAERLQRSCVAGLPLPAGAWESSLWLEKTGGGTA